MTNASAALSSEDAGEAPQALHARTALQGPEDGGLPTKVCGRDWKLACREKLAVCNIHMYIIAFSLSLYIYMLIVIRRRTKLHLFIFTEFIYICIYADMRVYLYMT